MHNVEHWSYKENVDRDKVRDEIDYYVAHEDWQEGCAGLLKGIRWLDAEPICESYSEAVARLEKLDRGGYDNLAVRFYERRKPNDKKMKELVEKAEKALKEYEEVNKASYPKSLHSEFVTCKSCGSKLKRELIRGNSCPLCGVDMRPESWMKRIEVKDAALKKAQREVFEHEKKGKKEVKWLVKFEYHT